MGRVALGSNSGGLNWVDQFAEYSCEGANGPGTIAQCVGGLAMVIGDIGDTGT